MQAIIPLLPQYNPYSCIIESPIGQLGLVISNGVLTKLSFVEAQAKACGYHIENYQENISLITNLNNYFLDPTIRFDMPIRAAGTVLQQKIWEALKEIPSGKTLSYGELAQKLNTGPRVIGNACRKNPIPIIIPCHRIVSAKDMGGYLGSRYHNNNNNKNLLNLNIKKWLLQHENKHSCF